MNRLIIWSGLIFILICGFATKISLNTSNTGIMFYFSGKKYYLSAQIRLSKNGFSQRGGVSKSSLDTIFNCYYTSSNYVEIIRQDDALSPNIGLALGFEFDETNGEYPYTPAHAVLQLKNFTWGGLEFSTTDSLNYTGVSDSISDDLFIEIDRYQNDTISGRFSGLLLSGAGGMSQIDSGYFKVKLFRKALKP
jgi:hypothetical protein